MPRLSFRQYVLTHSPEDSPAGDFIMDSKSSASFPNVTSWEELEDWLHGQGASQPAINAGRDVWTRYEAVRETPQVELGLGLTVRQLIDLLLKENPDAHVVKFHPARAAQITRVLGFSKVSIGQPEKRVLPAIMLE